MGRSYAPPLSTPPLHPKSARCICAAMAGAPLLHTAQLTRAFGSLVAVDRVDVSVREGELRSIIGPNGAGKTTFFRLISGEMPPTSGRIFFRGQEITGLAQHAAARL